MGLRIIFRIFLFTFMDVILPFLSLKALNIFILKLFSIVLLKVLLWNNFPSYCWFFVFLGVSVPHRIYNFNQKIYLDCNILLSFSTFPSCLGEILLLPPNQQESVKPDLWLLAWVLIQTTVDPLTLLACDATLVLSEVFILSFSIQCS